MITSLLLLIGQVGSSQMAPVDIATVQLALAQQDAAWEDLTVDYFCEVLRINDKGQLTFDHRKKLRWLITKKGWERFERITPEKLISGDKRRDWVEAATFNGDYSMAFDSQHSCSGGFGHAFDQFINNGYSVKQFGLCVTGLDVNQPLTVARFLEMKATKAKIVSASPGSVVVTGEYPLMEGVSHKVWLDPKLNYRPVRIERRDRRGLLSIFETQYKRMRGARGDWWFPETGTWQGVDSETRALSNQMRYRLDKIEVDTNPPKSAFNLTFPEGATLSNYDTRQAFYVTTPITTSDVPPFRGKVIPWKEHQEQLRNAEGVQTGAPVGREKRTRTWMWWLLGNSVLISALGLYWLRKKLARSRTP